MSNRAPSFFDAERLTLPDALDLTAETLASYLPNYRHVAIAYSGGKDSSATLTAVVRLIDAGRIPKPESLTVLYADTRLELPPLQIAAFGVLDALAARGINTEIVLPAMDDRFFVYVLGKGVPPPKHNFRWCTPQIKIEPMLAALAGLRERTGEKLLMVTGVRLGESAVRDQRIALSCSRDGAECGQGWFQRSTDAAVADTLAPLLHWRVCHVWDWLTFDAPQFGFPTRAIAEVYGGDEAQEVNARTGCIGCPLASKDTALEEVLKLPHWAYLAPLRRLRPLYDELRKPKWRLRKDGTDRKQDGTLAANPMRMGPLTFAGRHFGLDWILDLQGDINREAERQDRPRVELINAEELARIEELIAAETWPQGWDGSEAPADLLLPQVVADGVTQNVLLGLRS